MPVTRTPPTTPRSSNNVSSPRLQLLMNIQRHREQQEKKMADSMEDGNNNNGINNGENGEVQHEKQVSTEASALVQAMQDKIDGQQLVIEQLTQQLKSMMSWQQKAQQGQPQQQQEEQSNVQPTSDGLQMLANAAISQQQQTHGGSAPLNNEIQQQPSLRQSLPPPQSFSSRQPGDFQQQRASALWGEVAYDQVMRPPLIKHTFKLTPFWPRQPEMWFTSIKSQFAANRIESDFDQFHSVAAALDPETLSQVFHIIENPPAVNMFDTLKTELIKRFADSKQKQIKQLIQELTLGDRKPSFLLNDMRRLGGTSLGEETLKLLWLSKLPAILQSSLIMSVDQDINTLSLLADQIHELSPKPQIFGIVNSAKSGQEVEVAALVKRLEKLETNQRQSRSTSQGSSNSQQRDEKRGTSRRRFVRSPSTSPAKGRSSRSPSPKPEKKKKICFFHKRFKDKAYKCDEDCEWFAENPNFPDWRR